MHKQKQCKFNVTIFPITNSVLNSSEIFGCGLTFADSNRIHQMIIQPEPNKFGFFILLLQNLNQISTMGMFDTITINASMLPVSEKDRKRLEGQHYQTKSLGESLQHYRVTDEGVLETDWDMLWWRLNNSSWGKPRTEELVPPEENWETVKITDSIRFYTHTEDNREFFEFVAFFELGKMLIIRKLIGIDTVKLKIKRKVKT